VGAIPVSPGQSAGGNAERVVNLTKQCSMSLALLVVQVKDLRGREKKLLTEEELVWNVVDVKSLVV
jgi:hypothetical protein